MHPTIRESARAAPPAERASKSVVSASHEQGARLGQRRAEFNRLGRNDNPLKLLLFGSGLLFLHGAALLFGGTALFSRLIPLPALDITTWRSLVATSTTDKTPTARPSSTARSTGWATASRRSMPT